MIRGEIWWADLGIPFGSESGFIRPVLIIQEDSFNSSRLNTTIVISITTNLELGRAPGNIIINSDESGLPKPGVINISQISTIEKRRLHEKVSTLSISKMDEVNYGLKLILDIYQ